MAKTFNQFKKKIDELYWPKAGDEAKFMAMHGPYAAADVGGPETHDDAVFKGTIVQKDHTKLAPSSEELPDGQSELNDLIKNIHSRATDELLKTVSHLNLSTDPKHREHRDVINKELMYRYKNHSVNEELKGNQHKIDADGDKRITPKDFSILRARKKKMNEAMDGPHGFVPKGDREAFGTHMAKAGHQTAIQSDEPERDYSASSNPKHGATKTHAAVRLNNPAAREHAKKFPGFTTSVNEEELDEGKFGNAMAKFTDKSKAPFVSKVIHGIQTRQAASAAKKSKADPDNFDKLMNYANARNKVREESEVEEGYVSVNGQRVGPRRQPMSFAQRVAARGGERTPEQKAKTEKALKDIEDKMSAKFTPDYMKKTADNAAAERKRQVDAEKAKRGISESSHKIARAIMMNEKVNLNTEEIELEDGNVIEIDIELAEAIADLFDSLDEDDQDALAEMLHSNIDSFMEVVDLLENDGE